MRTRRVLAVLVAVLACSLSQARTLDQVPPYLEKEGKFVSYPALGMGMLGAFVGTVVSLPAVIIAAPIGWAADDTLGYVMVPASVMATGGAEAGYHLGGAIPWALKNGFYDAPMMAVARIKGEPASGLVAQVDPPPAHRGDIQYLETTPPAARVPIALARQYSSALPPPKPPTSLMLRRQLSPFKAPALPAKGAAPVAPRMPLVPPAAVAPPRPLPVSPAPVAPASDSAPPFGGAPMPTGDRVPSTEPSPVAAPMPAASSVLVTAPPPVSVSEPVTEPVPAVGAAPETAEASEDDESRPAIKKKKRKFSERFSF